MTKITKDFESQLDEVPEHWLHMIFHYVVGFRNDTIDFSEPILKPVIDRIYPLFLIQYGLLSCFGAITNMAIIVYIMRYKFYRDATHAFILNLAFCQFVQCIIVLPITLMVLLIQNWIFGQFMCFFLPMLQDIPLHVAMISHLLIAWDRMRWLGDPLKTRLPAFVCSCASWLTGMVIALPYPIYTTYLDLGMYLKQFQGVGICAVNLVDDMHEYMRGLFVIMYCAPMTVLAYLYIRTAKELRPPDGPLAVMMFEARADARNKQRNSTTSASTRPKTGRSRSYDLYDAELDVTREKRTQRHLGTMAATQVICVCPLMILRLARMALVETYENATHFDLTYLMFVWIAFLPCAINPWIYGSWMLSRSAKERLRGYLRLSSRRKQDSQESRDDSITQDVTTTTTVTTTATSNGPPITVNVGHQKLANVTTISKDVQNPPKTARRTFESANKQKVHHEPIVGGFIHRDSLLDPLTNSCSNITSSTYCNNGTERGSIDFDNASSFSVLVGKDTPYEKKPLCDSDEFYGREKDLRPKMSFKGRRDPFTGSENNSRKGSTSTLERDLEIIDLLERERSMDIQDMLARERNASISHAYITQQNSITERHRRLPDPEKIVNNSFYNPTFNPPLQKERSNSGDFPDIHNHRILSRKSSHNSHHSQHSHSSHTKHDTIVSTNNENVYDSQIVDGPRILEQRFNRNKGSVSSRSSTRSKERRYSNNKDFRENSFGEDI